MIKNEISDIYIKQSSQNIYNLKNQTGDFVVKLAKNVEIKLLIINTDGDLSVTIHHEEWAKSDVQIINRYINKKTEMVCNSNLSAGASSDIYMLSFLTEGSDVVADANIFMMPGALWSSGHLLEENLILSPKVRIYAKPVLDVQNSQVSASHWARISKIDNKNLFYMMSRGLSREQATAIIVDWYANKILDKIDLSDEDKNFLKLEILN